MANGQRSYQGQYGVTTQWFAEPPTSLYSGYYSEPKQYQDVLVGNLVLLWSPRTKSSDKFESKWEGSYVIIEKTKIGAYRLMNPQGPKL
jgi:hypothetical protein